MNVRGLASGLLFAAGFAAAAQITSATPDVPTAQSLEAKLSDQFVLLRGMYDGEQVTFDSAGQLIGSASPMPFSLSFLVVKKVEISEDKVEVYANRAGLDITRGWPAGKPDKVKTTPIDKSGRFQVLIMIARDPAHPDQLNEAVDRIFHAGFDEGLVQAAPQYWRPWILHQLHPERPYPEVPVGVETGPGQAPNRKPRADAITYPRLTHMEPAMITEAARVRRLQGESTIGVVVDESGAPKDAVIVSPLGMGLDEMAVLAVMKSQFTPATKNGRPVPVWINIQQNFR
jgi:TonB family protein